MTVPVQFLSTFRNKQIKMLKTWQDHFLLTRFSFEKYSKKKDTPCENLRFFKSGEISSSIKDKFNG